MRVRELIQLLEGYNKPHMNPEVFVTVNDELSSLRNIYTDDDGDLMLSADNVPE